MGWVKCGSGAEGDFVKRYFGELITGKWINPNDGREYSEGNWSATDYLEVVGGADLIVVDNGGNQQNYNAFYDENKTYISGTGVTGRPIQVPANAKYIRISNADYLISADMYYLVPVV